MGTRGKAREATIAALEDRKPFKRAGFGMWAVAGAERVSDRMPVRAAEAYAADCDKITYTVMSFATPIAWVLVDGTVKIPAYSYSKTTNGHQHLCRMWLTRGANWDSVL